MWKNIKESKIIKIAKNNKYLFHPGGYGGYGGYGGGYGTEEIYLNI